MTALSERVWVPYQAGAEFYRNRTALIVDQQRKYDELHETLSGYVKSLNDQAFQKSAFLPLEDIRTHIESAVAASTQILDDRRRTHPDLLRHDVYLEALVGAIGDKVGHPPNLQLTTERERTAQARIDAKTPPGYRDAKKDPPARYGDVFIWLELLDHSRDTQLPIVLVTDDNKDDWWESALGRRLGPRAELRAEMRLHSGQDFHLISPARLLQIAQESANVPVRQSSITDATATARHLRDDDDVLRRVEELASAVRDRPSSAESFTATHVGRSKFASAASKAVEEWLAFEHPVALVKRDVRTDGFVVRSEDGEAHVRMIMCDRSAVGAVVLQTMNAVRRATKRLGSEGAEHAIVVLAGENLAHMNEIYSALIKRLPPQTGRVQVTIGVVDDAEEFEEIGREYF